MVVDSSRGPAAVEQVAQVAQARRRVPRPSRVIIAVLLLVVVAVMLVEAYTNAGFAPDSAQTTTRSQSDVPQSVIDGGPIINTANGQIQSYGMPEKTIVLTFDDGPDPWWTPKILEVLRDNDVKATFFVVGSQVARHPDVAARIAREGHELGVHTFTHPDLSAIPAWQRRLEYSQTQMAIAKATGVQTSLIRFPYSSTPAAIDNPNWSLILEAGDLGYLTVVNDTDSDDWARPGVDKIVQNATPKNDPAGAITLWHDAGGERSQTLTALQRFIPAMKAKGYRFTTVAEGLNLGLTDPEITTEAEKLTTNTPASPADQWRGKALVSVVWIADHSIYGLGGLFVVVGVLSITRNLMLFLFAGLHVRSRRSKKWSWGPPVTEPVSVIVPAYNEKEGIADAVRSLAAGDHPGIEVIVVDDGSTDNTAEIAAALGLPNVRVVRKPNGGKPSALNVGVALASHDLVVMVDGDTIFEKDAIRHLVQPFADPQVGAVAGNVKVGNRDSLVAKWQHIEYVIGFNLDRRLYETLRCMPTVPGAIGAFRKDALVYAGGMTDDTLAEDTDITMALCRAGWKIVYEEKARAWTEAPATLAELWKQRYRWSYGTMQAMWKHRKAVVDHGASGRFGRRGLPFLVLFGLVLPILAPVIDVLALYSLIFANRAETALVWLAMLGMQAVTAIIAFRIDKEKLRPLWALPLQQFAYRQVMYLVLIQSAVTALTGARLRWQKLHRTGQAMPTAVSVVAISPPADPAVDPAVDPATVKAPAGSGHPLAGSDYLPAESALPAAVGAAADKSHQPALAKSARRDRYFDALRAVALVRVVAYHLFGGAVLGFVFPAIGVMFAMAGSLMAHSLLTSPVEKVIHNRLRRLLPALWVLGGVLVPLMFWHGWPAPNWSSLLLWIFPIAEPPGTEWAVGVTQVLWYVVTYLWLVLLTPLAMAAYRRWPVRTILFPLVVLAALEFIPADLFGEAAGTVVTDLAIFGACWILGFAHRDGSLRRLAWPWVVILAAASISGGAAWAYTHPSEDSGLDLNDIPMAQALYSLGFVLLLLRIAPKLNWLGRVRPLDRLIMVLNARAVTVYLWHNPAIGVAFVLADLIGASRLDDEYATLSYVGVVIALLVVAVLALGWVEDLAGRRPPRLLPGGEGRREKRRKRDADDPPKAPTPPSLPMTDLPTMDLQRSVPGRSR